MTKEHDRAITAFVATVYRKAEVGIADGVIEVHLDDGQVHVWKYDTIEAVRESVRLYANMLKIGSNVVRVRGFWQGEQIEDRKR